MIDSEDLLRDPRGVLTVVRRLGVELDEGMLEWPAGPRATDGIWAKYWYDQVERSTGFEPWAPRPRPAAPELEPLLEQCLPYYEALDAQRLRAVAMLQTYDPRNQA